MQESEYYLHIRPPRRVDPEWLRRQWAGRDKLIGTFSRYKDLVAEAKRRTEAAGYPKSRWMDLFDWHKS